MLDLLKALANIVNLVLRERERIKIERQLGEEVELSFRRKKDSNRDLTIEELVKRNRS